ncbi:MAG: EutN/CcmL family microcompartment protein [Actinomycetota bacterium]|jgi:microcompartment protein CcmK/EutM|nr:EutN/CcmL family microcompartment protein [Actinomycetota bacterium]
MFYAKVIGKTYSNFKHPSLEGIAIKIIEDVNIKTGQLTGKKSLAMDPLGVSMGEYVGYEVSTEATWAFEDRLVPADTTITAIIDSVDLGGGD